MSTVPIACSLTADQIKCESSILLPGLSLCAQSGEWMKEGIRLRFSPTTENLEAIVQTVDKERRCCAFLNFRVEVPPAAGAITLEISGPTGTRDFFNTLRLQPPPVPDHDVHGSN